MKNECKREAIIIKAIVHLLKQISFIHALLFCVVVFGDLSFSQAEVAQEFTQPSEIDKMEELKNQPTGETVYAAKFGLGSQEVERVEDRSVPKTEENKQDLNLSLKDSENNLETTEVEEKVASASAENFGNEKSVPEIEKTDKRALATTPNASSPVVEANTKSEESADSRQNSKKKMSTKSQKNQTLKITQYFKTGTRRDHKMEGTGNTSNGCVLGKGAYNNCLIPCFCVAVDRRYHKLGSLVRIPALAGAKCRIGKGAKLMEMEKSQEFKENVIVDYSEGENAGFATNVNGVFRACDTGSAIKGPKRFDFFFGDCIGKARRDVCFDELAIYSEKLWRKQKNQPFDSPMQVSELVTVH